MRHLHTYSIAVQHYPTNGRNLVVPNNGLKIQGLRLQQSLETKLDVMMNP